MLLDGAGAVIAGQLDAVEAELERVADNTEEVAMSEDKSPSEEANSYGVLLPPGHWARVSVPETGKGRTCVK
jgi:hypothetical protein